MKSFLLILALLTVPIFGAADGSVWRDGTGIPANSLGVDNDYYLERATGDVYRKSSGVYAKVANIRGPQGPAGTGTPPDTAQPFVTAVVLGTLRSNYGGWAGMRIEVGTAPISVTELGRIMAPGNTGAHAVKLVNASDGTDVAGGAVSVTMSGTVGAFQYQALGAPVTLSAGTTYYVVSNESDGGDAWHDLDTQLTTTSAAKATATVYWSGTAWVAGTASNRGFVPVSLKYTTGATPVPVPIPPVSGVENIAPGTKATLTLVSFEGDSPPTSLQWLKDGAPLTGATAAAYIIASAKATDAGDYVLKVANAKGTASSGIKITVQ